MEYIEIWEKIYNPA
nr:hypothetical protein [Segatella copri]